MIKGRTFVVFVSILMLSLVAPLSTSAHVHYSTPLSDDEALFRDAQSYAAEVGVSIDEALERLKLQSTIGQLETELRLQEADTFAGMWIEHTPTFEIVVQFTDYVDDTRMQSYIEQGLLTDMINVQTAQWSLAQLEANQAMAISTAQEMGVTVESGINVFKNQVELYVEEEADLNLLVEQAALTPESVLNDDTGMEFIKVDAFSTADANIFGGLAMSTCTSGFAVSNSGGTRGVTTAGHCGNSQQVVGESLSFQQEQFGGSSDLQWHTAPGNTILPQFFDGSSNRSVTGTRSRNSQPLNGFVCKYGKTTGNTCGFIVDKNLSLSFVPNSSATFIRVSNDGQDLSSGGDSGGPWFSGNTAYGIHSCGIGNDSCYTAINYVSGLGVSVLTN